MKRKRKLNTTTIFEYLVNGAITNTGISTCVNIQRTGPLGGLKEN